MKYGFVFIILPCFYLKCPKISRITGFFITLFSFHICFHADFHLPCEPDLRISRLSHSGTKKVQTDHNNVSTVCNC